MSCRGPHGTAMMLGLVPGPCVTCALRSRPPVLPPKMGLGVSGLSVGSVHLGASVAVSARTCTCLRLRGRAAGLGTALAVLAWLTT